jgi:hypothetical protein
MKSIRYTIIVSIVAFVVSSCDIINPDAALKLEGETYILYVASGGFAGGVLEKLSITKDGLATNEMTTPELRYQLTPDEHDELLVLFNEFNSLPESFEDTVCADDILYEVTLHQNDQAKTVAIWGCTFAELKKTDPAVMKLSKIISVLRELAKMIYEKKAPWLGLEADCFIDDDTFGVGETIMVTCRIMNPTDNERMLYFAGDHKIAFRAARPSISGFSYWHPEHNPPESDNLKTMTFVPGEEKVLTYTWDMIYEWDDGKPIALEPDRYFMSIRLLDTSRRFGAGVGIPFDVVDRSLPIAGYVIPDYSGEGRDIPVYTFKINVRNWTDAPVTLHFPYREHLYVRIFDLNGPKAVPPPLLYEGPEEPEEEESIVILQPGETQVFEYAVNKSELNLTYLWYLAELTLMIEDFDFIRESHLRIFYSS